VSWYRRAAEAGDSVAQFNMGLRHSKGHGVVKDLEQAVSWYRRVAAAGDASARVRLKPLLTGNGRDRQGSRAGCAVAWPCRRGGPHTRPGLVGLEPAAEPDVPLAPTVLRHLSTVDVFTQALSCQRTTTTGSPSSRKSVWGPLRNDF